MGRHVVRRVCDLIPPLQRDDARVSATVSTRRGRPAWDTTGRGAGLESGWPPHACALASDPTPAGRPGLGTAPARGVAALAPPAALAPWLCTPHPRRAGAPNWTRARLGIGCADGASPTHGAACQPESS